MWTYIFAHSFRCISLQIHRGYRKVDGLVTNVVESRFPAVSRNVTFRCNAMLAVDRFTFMLNFVDQSYILLQLIAMQWKMWDTLYSSFEISDACEHVPQNVCGNARVCECVAKQLNQKAKDARCKTLALQIHIMTISIQTMSHLILTYPHTCSLKYVWMCRKTRETESPIHPHFLFLIFWRMSLDL